MISIPTKYPSCVFSCTPITGHISSSELGLATKKLLTQRFEFDMREMDGVEMEILTKDSGNPYLSIYNPDTEEEYPEIEENREYILGIDITIVQ